MSNSPRANGPPPGRWRAIRKYIYLLGEEIRRTFIIMRRYWMNSLTLSLEIYLIFLFIVLMGGALARGGLSAADKSASLIGMLFWQFSLSAVSVLGWSFFNEAATGTLEHLYLSPMGVAVVFVARAIADFVGSLATVLVTALLAVLTTGVRLHLPLLTTAVILPLGVAGAYGFGFILAALTLTFKRTQAMINLIQYFFLFFTGALMPMQSMHPAIQAFSRLLPMTASMDALRSIAIEGSSLGQLTGDLVQMVATSAVWLAVGLVVYRFADRRARMRGSVGQY